MGVEYQKEFFDEFKKEKGKFKKIADRINRRQPKFYVRLSLENVVFAAIIGIMCMVVAFAFGVERGKRLGRSAPAAERARQEEPAQEESVAARTELAMSEVEPRTFVIQLISYRKRELAEKEKKLLLDKKINAFIIPSGKWHQVCAGGYKDMEEARIALEAFKKDYNGCFIRKGGE